MRKILFPDDFVRVTPKRKNEIEKKITSMEKLIEDYQDEVRQLKHVLTCERNKDAVEMYWNHLGVTGRRNLGKSREEIENPDTMTHRSAIDFGGVAQLEFKDLNPLWQATVLSGLSEKININTVMQWMDNT